MQNSLFLVVVLLPLAAVAVAACGETEGSVGGGPDGGASDSATVAPGDAKAADATASIDAGAFCVFGQDQSCNADPAAASLSGRCDEAGQCRCEAGATLLFGGKCGKVKEGGLGRRCATDAECAAGFSCLPIANHPTPTTCEEVGRVCTVACASGGSSCEGTFGPSVHCFAGCDVGGGVCGIIAEKK